MLESVTLFPKNQLIGLEVERCCSMAAVDFRDCLLTFPPDTSLATLSAELIVVLLGLNTL